MNISNVGRAIPIVALLSLLALGFVGSAEFGPFGRAGLATLITLALFALPPIITNAYVAVSGVDDDLVEAARGMGMDERQVLRRVELPVALPLIVSGVRLAVVQVWATATVAALVAGPGLGRIITHGYDSNRPAEVIAGSLIVARDRAGAREPDGAPAADARPASCRQSLESDGSGLVQRPPDTRDLRSRDTEGGNHDEPRTQISGCADDPSAPPRRDCLRQRRLRGGQRWRRRRP